MSFEIKQTSAETLPTGNYVADIVDLQLTSGQFGEQVEWLFSIKGGEHDGAKLKGWTSATFSPKSKLFKWTRAAFEGKQIPVGYDFKAADVMGRTVKLVVVERAREDGSTFSKIDDVRPLDQDQAPLFPGDTPEKQPADSMPF